MTTTAMMVMMMTMMMMMLVMLMLLLSLLLTTVDTQQQRKVPQGCCLQRFDAQQAVAAICPDHAGPNKRSAMCSGWLVLPHSLQLGRKASLDAGIISLSSAFQLSWQEP
uniref:Secreted protein n=1 Tax=Anopheles farauti TaxID=69004 RepID=A0A182QV37_9DIPT